MAAAAAAAAPVLGFMTGIPLVSGFRSIGASGNGAGSLIYEVLPHAEFDLKAKQRGYSIKKISNLLCTAENMTNAAFAATLQFFYVVFHTRAPFTKRDELPHELVARLKMQKPLPRSVSSRCPCCRGAVKSQCMVCAVVGVLVGMYYGIAWSVALNDNDRYTMPAFKAHIDTLVEIVFGEYVRQTQPRRTAADGGGSGDGGLASSSLGGGNGGGCATSAIRCSEKLAAAEAMTDIELPPTPPTPIIPEGAYLGPERMSESPSELHVPSEVRRALSRCMSNMEVKYVSAVAAAASSAAAAATAPALAVGQKKRQKPTECVSGSGEAVALLPTMTQEQAAYTWAKASAAMQKPPSYFTVLANSAPRDITKRLIESAIHDGKVAECKALVRNPDFVESVGTDSDQPLVRLITDAIKGGRADDADHIKLVVELDNKLNETTHQIRARVDQYLYNQNELRKKGVRTGAMLPEPTILPTFDARIKLGQLVNAAPNIMFLNPDKYSRRWLSRARAMLEMELAEFKQSDPGEYHRLWVRPPPARRPAAAAAAAAAAASDS